MFKKGNVSNPKGRTPGTPNKVTADLRTRINALLSDSFEQIVEDFNQLEPRERVVAWAKLAEYVLPKLQRTETVVDVSKLTDDEVDGLLNAIFQKRGEYDQ